MPAREIGSDFYFSAGTLLRRRTNKGLALDRSNTVHLGSGRDALHWIISSLRLPQGSHVLLPAYLCKDVIKPFVAHDMAIDFYGVTKELQIDARSLARKLLPETRVFLYIHYFGFPTDLPASLVESFAPRTAVIEDASHSFLSHLGLRSFRGDIQFASYRKLLPVPNGAAVSWDDRRLPDPVSAKTRLSVRYIGALSCRCSGALLKDLWLRRPGIFPKQVFRQLFSWSEVLLDAYPKPAPMAAISRHLLNRMDLSEVVQARRRNFQFLLAGLRSTEDLRPLYTTLPEGICPLGFPVLVDDRDALARHLIKHRVYPPVQWKLPEAVDRQEFREAWATSDHILTIPIDQRYDEEDMVRILGLINSYTPAKEPWPAGR